MESSVSIERQDDPEESAVQDFLTILEEHRRNCERQGKYAEAEIAKNRLYELRLHEENRRREAMRSRQIAERLGVEEAHMLEFQQFNMLWNQKMSEYQQQAEVLEKQMQERHEAEIAEFQNSLLEKGQFRPRFSKELLAMRQIQDKLAKTKDYSEAHKMKVKADRREAWELKQTEEERQKKLVTLQNRFQRKQQQELQALRQRVQIGWEEQARQRQKDLERLLQRYQNVKSELEAQQNLERLRMDRYPSTSNSMSKPPTRSKTR